MIFLGIECILIGFIAITLKKYPIKNLSFRNLQRKYDNVDEKKAIKFDGIFCMLLGVNSIILGILDIRNSIILYLTIVFSNAFLCIIYYPIRRKYLHLK